MVAGLHILSIGQLQNPAQYKGTEMKVLIIDDEKISRKVLLKQMEGVGDCTAVDNSRKGLEMVEKSLSGQTPYDLITMDVSMPKMDGRMLLKRIREKEKELNIKKRDRIKIIMVTSRMNISTIKECIGLGCDGYLSKPVNRYQLFTSLAKLKFADLPKVKATSDGSKSITSQVIKRLYAGKIKLPVLPGIAHEVQALAARQNADMDDMADIIKKDIVISSKLISIANSSLYKGVEKVDSLNAALVRLGMKAASGVITTMTTRGMFRSNSERLNTFLKKLWAHSFACACLSKRIAEEVKLKNADTLFLMGIVHDIGKTLLIRAISDIDPGEPFDEEVQVAIHEIHTTFGAVLLKKLRFPKAVASIAEFHHWNDFSKGDDPELIIVSLADDLANMIGYTSFWQEDTTNPDDSDAAVNIAHLKVVKLLGLKDDRLQEIIRESGETIKETAGLF